MQAGVEHLRVTTLNGGKLLQYTGTFKLVQFMVKIFLNNNGKCTIGHGSGFERGTFDVLAEAIVSHCRIGEKAPLEVSVTKFEVANQEPLLEHLKNLGARVETDNVKSNYRILRIKGPLGDTLTVKFFLNLTIQLQGSHAQLAVWALDFLNTVMPFEQMVEQQRTIYKLPMTIDDIKSNLVARVPHAHDALVDEVRRQLSTALAMTKVAIELEDYAILAFPALKGLEGFCFQLLRDECKFMPVKKSRLGEYFVIQDGRYAMETPHSDGLTIELQDLLVQCYKTWCEQRHRLFHMDGTLETTRILEDRDDAIAIVNGVLDTIDQGYATILMLKVKP